jgi:hypothetical protein
MDLNIVAAGEWVENLLLALCTERSQSGGCLLLKSLHIRAYASTDGGLSASSKTSDGGALGNLALGLLLRRQHSTAGHLTHLRLNFGDERLLQELEHFIPKVDFLVRSSIDLACFPPVDISYLFWGTVGS